MMSRDTSQIDAEFTFRVDDIHYSRIKVVELVPKEKVVWLIVENFMNYGQDQTEWVGTKIKFEIATKGDQTQVRFSHLGWMPAYECFESCSNAWAFFLKDSLRDLIATGESRPHRKIPARLS